MEVKEMAVQTFRQIWDTVDRALEGLSQEELAAPPRPECNSIGWIAWHMARVEDRIWSALANRPQLWERGWAENMGMADETSTGGGMTPEEVAQFKTPTLEQLKSYTQGVREATTALLLSLTPERLDEEVDAFPGYKMTVGRWCTHLFCELNQHAGQVAYLRGFLRGYEGAA